MKWLKKQLFKKFNIGYHAVKRFCKSEKECRYIYHMFYKKTHPILNLKQTGRNLTNECKINIAFLIDISAIKLWFPVTAETILKGLMMYSICFHLYFPR